MINQETSRTDLGTIKIHKNVIASIAAVAATEIDGVKRVGTVKSSFLELFSKKDLDAITVEFNKNGEVHIDIPIIFKYDCNIPEVANKVQESIRNALEKMTSLQIRDIDISVQGIEKE
jgi:uncharacterized alkaline shock family protein YloU